MAAFDLDRALEAKALANHPAWASNAPTSVYSPGATRTDAVISQREASRHMDAYGGKQAIDWVYDAIGLFADPAGTAPYHLERDDGTKLVEKKLKGTPPDHEIGPADLYRLLKAPNPFMLYDELVALLVIDLMLVGNGYWFKWQVTSDGKPLALYRLAPSHVKIIPGAYGPKRYEYQPPGAKKPLKIDPENMIHFRRPNPHSAYYGMGVIQGAGRSMDLELAITDTMASYYENRADPSMIVQSERRVPRDVFNKLRAQLRSRTAGSKRAGELLVLEAGLKASSLSANARDALFHELSQMSRDRILTKFRASPMLFGLMDQASGSNKVSDARREFDNYTLRPFLDRLQRTISATLAAAWGCEFVIDHQTLLPPEEQVKVVGEMAKVPGIKIRELRRQFAQFGIEESTGDEEVDEFILNKPGPEMDANGQVVDPITGKVVAGQKINAADQPLPGEPGRPPKGENTRGFGSAKPKSKPSGKSLDEIESWLDGLIEEQKALNAAGENVSIGNKLPGEQRPDDPFARARTADIDAARDYAVGELRDAVHYLERDLLDTVEGKALKTSDIVKRVRQSKAWGNFKDRLTEIMEETARRAAISGVMHSDRTPDDEVDYDAIAKSVAHRPEGIRGILKTLRDRVVRRVTDARGANAERGDYDAAVRAVIAEWADSQAMTIADSEATEAYNEAVLTVLEMTGETEVFVEDGIEDDEPCIEADGQVWPIDYARQHRKEHPRCRRAFLAVPQVA